MHSRILLRHTAPAPNRLKNMADNKDDELPMIDLAQTEGWVVDDTDEDDPVLLLSLIHI